MSLFDLIEKSGFDFNATDLSDEKELIRIEKKLRAEARLAKDVDINTVETVLTIIRNHTAQLTLLYRNEFKLVRLVLAEPKRLRISEAPALPDLPADELEALKKFFTHYFKDTISEYVNHCLKKGYYNALYAFLGFKAIIPTDILGVIIEKLENKLNFAVECVKANISSTEEKIHFATNPFFYRCLYRAESVYFEPGIRSLLNSAIGRFGRENVVKQISYAMGAYTTHDENLKETLKKNWEYAYRRGVREVAVDPVTGLKTGGTEVLDNHENSVISNLGCRVLVVLTIVAMILNSYLISSDDDDESEVNIEMLEEHNASQLLEETLRDSVEIAEEIIEEIPETEEIVIQGGPHFGDIIEWIHGDPSRIIAEVPIPFESHKTGLNKVQEYKLHTKNIKVVNKTGGRVLIQIKYPTYKHHELIENNGAAMLFSTVLGIRVYPGDEPQVVAYKDEGSRFKEHFRFASATKDDVAEAQRFHALNRQGFSKRHSYIITLVRNGKIALEISRK